MKLVLWMWKEINKNEKQQKHDSKTHAEENVVKKKKNNEAKVVMLYVLATSHSEKSQH